MSYKTVIYDFYEIIGVIMNKKAIRIKKVESILSRKIEQIYQEQLEHQLDSISYRLFDSTLIILLEGTITPPEKLLHNSDRVSLAKEVREAIDSVIHPRIQHSIEETLEVKVVDFLSDTTIDNNLTGAIAIFEFEAN